MSWEVRVCEGEGGEMEKERVVRVRVVRECVVRKGEELKSKTTVVVKNLDLKGEEGMGVRGEDEKWKGRE